MQRISNFSDLTLIEAVNLFRRLTQAQFDQQMLYLSLDSEIPPGYGISVENKANMLVKFAKENPFHQTASGKNVDEEIIARTAEVPRQYGRSALEWALARDGYTLLDNGSLMASFPAVADLPEANDELCSLLDEMNMPVAKGHLDQAIENHAVGNWAAANSQLRSFLEEVFNEISKRVEPSKASDKSSSDNRRTLLAKSDPPFLMESLGEWSGDGKNFVNGIFKRLNPEGSHPGLSGDEDCTFRLHMVLIVGRHYLRRAKSRLS